MACPVNGTLTDIRATANFTPDVILTLAACVDSADPTAPVAREIYEVHVDLDSADAIELFEACPGLTQVRALTAPQVGGVDIRVEFSLFGSHKLAACVNEFLSSHGAEKFATDTYFPEYGSDGSGSTG